MSTRSPIVTLRKGYSVFITSISATGGWTQRASFDVTSNSGQLYTSQSLAGEGNRMPMKNLKDHVEYLAFGPYDGDATIRVTLGYLDSSGSFHTSNMLPPLEAVSDSGTAMIKSTTIFAQSDTNPSKESITTTIHQYKAFGTAAEAVEEGAAIDAAEAAED